MMRMRYIVIIFLLLFTVIPVHAQNDVALLNQNIRNARTDSERLMAYQQIYLRFEHTNIDTTLFYLQQGLDRFTADKYPHGRASLLLLQGGIYAEMGSFELAKQKEEEALKIFTDLQLKEGIATVNNGLGVIEGMKSNYNLAITHFITALGIFEAIHDTDGITNTYIKLGAANDLTQNHDKALDYYNKALIYAARDSIPNNTIYIYNNIGTSYCRKSSFDTAIVYFKKAMALSTGPQYTQMLLQPLTNLGNIYREKGDITKALDYYSQALNIAGKEQLKEEYTRLSLNMAVILSAKDPAKATTMLQEALKTSQEAGQKEMQVEVLDAMVEVYAHEKNFELAYKYQQQRQDLQDTLYDINKAKEIANLQAVYQLNKSNEQISNMRTLQQRNERKRDIIFVIALSLGVSVLSVLFLLRESRKLNTQLARKSDELKASNEVKDKLFSIIGHDLNGAMSNMPVLLELYSDKKTTPEEREFIINSLEETAMVSQEILENLLNWGKAQIKGITINQTVFDTTEIVNNKIRLARTAVNAKNITLASTVSPGTTAYADANHFAFILRNLLTNAIKYTDINGNIEIGADRSKEPGYVVFYIKDNGIGMTEDQQKKIFNAQNMSLPGTANEAGNSIGLILCKEFVIANGGRIWVDSERGKGSVFYFTLKQTV